MTFQQWFVNEYIFDAQGTSPLGEKSASGARRPVAVPVDPAPRKFPSLTPTPTFRSLRLLL
jgi:hypothetical protein